MAPRSRSGFGRFPEVKLYVVRTTVPDQILNSHQLLTASSAPDFGLHVLQALPMSLSLPHHSLLVGELEDA